MGRALAIVLFVCCLGSLRVDADEAPAQRQLPPAFQSWGLCGPLIPCARSGPLAAHLRGALQLQAPTPGYQMGVAGWIGVSASLWAWAEASISWYGRGASPSDPKGQGIQELGPFSFAARLSPPFLSTPYKDRGWSFAALARLDVARPPFDGGGRLFPDTQTYGAVADWQVWHLNASLYVAAQLADGRRYGGGEAGLGAWFRVFEHLHFGGEVLGRYGGGADLERTASIIGFLGLRYHDDWGMHGGGGAGVARGGVAPEWSATILYGHSWGPEYRPPHVPDDPLYQDQLLGLLSLLSRLRHADQVVLRGPALPVIPPPGLLSRRCDVVWRPTRCQVAGFVHHGGLPLQIAEALPEAEVVPEAEPGRAEGPARAPGEPPVPRGWPAPYRPRWRAGMSLNLLPPEAPLPRWAIMPRRVPSIRPEPPEPGARAPEVVPAPPGPGAQRPLPPPTVSPRRTDLPPGWENAPPAVVPPAPPPPTRAAEPRPAAPAPAPKRDVVTTPWQRRVYQREDIDWNLVRPDGRTNRQAAEKGFAPGRINPRTGKWDDVVLHHLNQDPEGSVAETWRSDHGRMPHKMDPPGAWRKAEPDWANSWRDEVPSYWKWRSGTYNPPEAPLRLEGNK